mmetsp:Transcript_12561/g.29556  ORF Transcript_12561/g.29556 Transcript_12561/m.29556 type:complete len:453 (+) Transcript_12561:946-2304(+)
MRSRWPMKRSGGSPSATAAWISSIPAFPHSILPCFLGKNLSKKGGSIDFSHRASSISDSGLPGFPPSGGAGQRFFLASFSRLDLVLFGLSARPSGSGSAPFFPTLPLAGAASLAPFFTDALGFFASLASALSSPLSLAPPAASLASRASLAEGLASSPGLGSTVTSSKILSSASLVVFAAAPFRLSSAPLITFLVAPRFWYTSAMTARACSRTCLFLSFMHERSWAPLSGLTSSLQLVWTGHWASRSASHSSSGLRAVALTKPSSFPHMALTTTSTHFPSTLGYTTLGGSPSFSAASSAGSPYEQARSIAVTAAWRIGSLLSAQASISGLVTSLSSVLQSPGSSAVKSAARAVAASGLLFTCLSARQAPRPLARSAMPLLYLRSIPSQLAITLSIASFRAFHFLASGSSSAATRSLSTLNSSRSPAAPAWGSSPAPCPFLKPAASSAAALAS